MPLPIHSLLCVTLKSDDDLEVECSAVEIVSHYLTFIPTYSLLYLQKPEMGREILQEAPEKFIVPKKKLQEDTLSFSSGF